MNGYQDDYYVEWWNQSLAEAIYDEDYEWMEVSEDDE